MFASTSSTVFAPGASVRGYEVIRLIGRGSASQVYEVLDPQGVRLALKVQAFSTEARREAQRFVREARSLRELHHPNIVRCEAIEVDDEQRLCIVLEYLVGYTLRHLLHVRRLGMREALTIGAQVAAALAAVHRRGLLHRDIKPENVFVMTGYQVKVIDFGLAKVVGTRGDTTRPVGTPLYMSPESLSGHDPTPAHDVYALGHVLYEMFRGRHAFAREDGILPSHAEIMVRHVRQPVPPLAQVLPHFPERLSSCVAKAMARDPHRRQFDGHTLEHELHAIRRDLQSHEEDGFRDRLSDLDLDWSLVPNPNEGAFEEALDHTKPSPSDLTLDSVEPSADAFEAVESTLPIFQETSTQRMKARTQPMAAQPDSGPRPAAARIVPPAARVRERRAPLLGWSHVGMLLVGLSAGAALFLATWWMGWW